MTPILGIMASQISGHLYAPTGSMYHIASTTLSTAAASVTFSSIPADYTHLQIRAIARTGRTGQNGDFFKTTFNADTASNYSWHLLTGDGASTGTGSGSSVAYMEANRFASNSTSANIFGAIVLDILDYANTNKYKTMRYLGGYDNNGSGEIQFGSGNWRSSSAITSITFTQSGAYNILQYSTFTLYGVK